MTFDHDFVVLFPFIFPRKKRGKKKRRMNSKNRIPKSYLSARSNVYSQQNNKNPIKIRCSNTVFFYLLKKHIA